MYFYIFNLQFKQINKTRYQMEERNNKTQQGIENGQAITASTQTQTSSAPNLPVNNNTNNQLEQSSNQMAKEIKILEMKNKKLQNKYIQLFKQQKLLKKDWTVFLSIIKIIFPNYEDKPLGKYDLDQIKDMWKQKQNRMERKIKQMGEDFEKQKSRMEQEISQLAEQKINNATRQCKQKVETTSKQLEAFKKNNKYLAQQLADIDKKLDVKNDEVSKLTKQKLKLEHQINQLKMKSITDELVEDKKIVDDRNKMERNQLLALRHQIGNIMQKRDQYRDQLKISKQQIAKLKQLLAEKEKRNEKNNQKNSQNGERKQKIQKEQNKKTNNKNENSSTQIGMTSETNLNKRQSRDSKDSSNSKDQQNNIHHLLGDDQYVHRQYMKNVFIRYMKSWTKGDPNQSQILLNIILTMLKFNGKQRQMIAEKKKAWWGLY